MPNLSDYLKKLKDWWWLIATIASALVLWGSLPDRMKKVEAEQHQQQEQVSELREWTKETQGFLKGQAALNERLAAQQAKEVSDDGEVKVMELDGKKWCFDAHDNHWPWSKQTQCAR